MNTFFDYKEMEVEEQTLFRKIQENDAVYRIKATIGLKSLSLVILHNVGKEISIYTSSAIPEQNLKIQAEELHMSFDDYFENLSSLLGNASNIKLVINNDVLTLVEVNPDFQAKYFHCTIQKVDNKFIGTLIDDLETQNMKLNTKCNELAFKNEQLSLDVMNYREKLNELVDRKIADEQKMLSNFVSLLNEKKRRIQHLNELLDAFRSDPSLLNPVEVNVNISKRRKIKNLKSEEPPALVKEEVSESDPSDHENLTDNDVDGENMEDISSKYDIFEEPISEVNSSVIKFPNTNLSTESFPSTSNTSIINSETKLKENEKYSASDYNIDTQEFLNNL